MQPPCAYANNALNNPYYKALSYRDAHRDDTPLDSVKTHATWIGAARTRIACKALDNLLNKALVATPITGIATL